MEFVLNIFEPLMSVAVVCFPITTVIMIFSLKRQGYDSVGGSVKSKWSFDIDLKFFSKLRKGYAQSKGNKVIPAINLFSFYVLTLGLIGMPIVLILGETW